MKKYFLMFLFGIAYSGVYSQIDENSLTYEYSNIQNDSTGAIDSSFVFGELTIQFDILDTLNFKGVQIQLKDTAGNISSNEIFLKDSLLLDGNYQMPSISLNLGYKIISEDRILMIRYLHINNLEFPIISKLIHYED